MLNVCYFWDKRLLYNLYPCRGCSVKTQNALFAVWNGKYWELFSLEYVEKNSRQAAARYIACKFDLHLLDVLVLC